MLFLNIGTIVISFLHLSQGFSPTPLYSNNYCNHLVAPKSTTTLRKSCSKDDIDSNISAQLSPFNNRRSFLQHTLLSSTILTVSTFIQPRVAYSDEPEATSTSASTEETTRTVQTPIYYILRVREATEQETRLIKSGKFKDVQRANVKLAVKFILENYRLNDNFIAASAFLVGNKRLQAVEIGQNTVQNLQTILEYFDSSDVQNIKVGSDSMAGKESLVLKGLEAARKGIDEFLSLFPKEDLDAVLAKIENENELNFKEFDPSLGSILNPKPEKAPATSP